MFKKNKIALAVILSASTLTWGVANATAAAPDYNVAGTAVTDATDVAEVQPKFVFSYNPAMSGVLVDITEGLKGTDPVDSAGRTAGDIDACGDNVAFEYVPLADMNCTSAGCEWLTPVALTDQHSYYISYDEVVDGIVSMTDRDSCKIGGVGDGAVFSVDTTAGGTTTTTPPTAPPAKVVMIPNTASCIAGANAPCIIEFEHDNSPSASYYRVWINDKNGIQIDEDKLNANASRVADTNGNGWFEVATDSTDVAAGASEAAVICAADLAGKRTCKLEIGSGHDAYQNMIDGTDVKVWVRAWNAKGYADWSDSEVYKVTD